MQSVSSLTNANVFTDTIKFLSQRVSRCVRIVKMVIVLVQSSVNVTKDILMMSTKVAIKVNVDLFAQMSASILYVSDQTFVNVQVKTSRK